MYRNNINNMEIGDQTQNAALSDRFLLLTPKTLTYIYTGNNITHKPSQYWPVLTGVDRLSDIHDRGFISLDIFIYCIYAYK